MTNKKEYTPRQAFKDMDLVRAVASSRLKQIVLNKQCDFERIGDKLSVLAAMGYENLRTGSGNQGFTRLGELDLTDPKTQRQISLVLRKMYAKAEERLEKNKLLPVCEYNRPEISDYNNLVRLIESEKGLSGDGLIEARERTAVVMADAPPKLLKMLSRKYGEKIMGGFDSE